MTTKILITGLHSYVGSSVRRWLEGFPGQYDVTGLSLRSSDWRSKSFSGFDSVLHVAGIAHVSADPQMERRYMAVNRDLAAETARKAKDEGAGQFIFMSSAIVYGDSASIGKDKTVTFGTAPAPTNFYGQSKLEAEGRLRALGYNSFKVAILRPPMIYGPGCKGNFPILVKLAERLPLFPDVDNQRSMLFIDNLCEFIRLLIDNQESGLFFPQNDKYVSTSHVVRLIAQAKGKNIRLTRLFNPALRLLARCTPLVDKAFGNFRYDQSMSRYKQNYIVADLEQSVKKSVIG